MPHRPLLNLLDEYDCVCDFCKHYAFNPDEDGAYTGNGRCEHPDHPRPSEPYDGCDDWEST